MTTVMNFVQGPLTHALTHALGWTLVHFLWQGALVAVVLWCVLALMAESSADARYAASCVGLLAMVVCPALTFVRLASLESKATLAQAGAVDGGSVAVFVGAGGGSGSWSAALTIALDHMIPFLMLAWCAGVLFFACRLAAGIAAAQRCKLQDTGEVSAWLREVFDTLRVRLGLHRAARLVESAKVHVPTVIGWLKPVVLLPAGCFAGMSEQQVEALLAHELAHICRNDYLVSVVQSIVETLLFYHPAVWWVSRQVRREREYCCDEMAVGVCGDRVAYARALSLLEERRALLPEVVLGANGGVLTMRIKRLLGYREEIVSSNMAWVIVLAVVIAGSGSIIGRLAYAESRPATAIAAQASAQIADVGEQAVRIAQTTKDAAAAEAQAADAENQVQEAAEQSKVIHKELEAAQQNLAQRTEDSSELTAEQREQLDEARKQVQDALKKLNSDELKKQLEQIRQQVNSPEFRKQIQAAADAARKVNSAEMRKQIAEAQEKIQKELNSPEFKQEIEQAKAAAAKMNSPEFRKQMEDIKKQTEQFNTPEFKERIKRLVDEAKAKQIQAEEQRGKIMANSAEANGAPPPPPPQQPGVAPPAPNGPIRVSSSIAQNQVLKQVQPMYPPDARAAGIQGTVMLKAVISKDGSVGKLTVVSGPKELMQSAIEAVSQWKYKPYLLNGQPVDVETTINVNYSLAESAPNPTPNPTPQANAAPDAVEKPVPALIYTVLPEYTAEAKAAKVQGPVVLNVTVTQEGLPTNVHVIRGLDPGLDKNAVSVVKQYRFKPAMKDGQPVETAVNVEVQYRIF
ncbi:MAG TPA: TonB family protein [Acidobacteriaceae bacterium]|jgi:TonB family protein|nr:TonB family protein [Acidobacteriaceae bacterium]